ncbi:putative N-acetylmannosamine-6-phosphate 2-epimerase [Rhizobium populisoli]|uniref:putative N-acetylmannosamine-6-phosphate 2-epimerase n=1 Tax=Rhizobium populisoli TaxID=2859785 RepID=UPI0028AF7753|nr:putative N-acetylmannosamine-6-phosphate 2-epimerase [Rhizobium populisoli]
MVLQGLVVSCQPVPAGPQDNADFVVGYAKAALASGAVALRIESIAYVSAVRAVTDAPIIGLIKRDLPDSPVRITPFVADVEALADAGADIIAFDATDRVRPASIQALIGAVKAKGRAAMADCSCLDDARYALAAGVDFVGTTLSGYVGGPEPREPDLTLISAIRALTSNVIAEGRIRSPDQAADAVRAGASAVVVGSAITRTEHVTNWFNEAVSRALVDKDEEAVLAIDIGGTKTMAALVSGSDVLEVITVATDRSTGPDLWLAGIADSTAAWNGRYRRVGIAATGLVREGCWRALNPATLTIPGDYNLSKKAQRVFKAPVYAINDAQAAAWGEYRFGAGNAEDMVFLTISTGIGGGIVMDGRLRRGLAGHFGLVRGRAPDGEPLENVVSGRWMAACAAQSGYPVDAMEVFARWRQGEEWATKIVLQSAKHMALLCEDIQLTLDPETIVIGGGIGLAKGFIEEMSRHLSSRFRPNLVAAKLDRQAGTIGVADLVKNQYHRRAHILQR